MKHRRARAFLFIAVTLLVPAVLLAQAQPRFEAVISGRNIYGACFILPISFQMLEWVNPDRVEENTNVIMVASAPGQPVYALRNLGQIVKLQPDGTQTFFAAGGGSSLAVATTGRVFVADSAPTLKVYSPAGVLEATYPLPGLQPFSESLAVAPDGCTVYYDKGSSVGRIDGCTGAVLSDFTAIPPFTLNDIYPLRNGEVLLALGSDVDLYSAAGTFVRTVTNVSTYGFDPLEFVVMQVAATADEQVLYLGIGNSCYVEGFLVRALMRDEGRELSRRLLALNDINGLVVGTASVLDAPTASETALMILMFALAVGGVFLLRR